MRIIKGSYHPIKDWVMDPKGYFLIRINEKLRRIEIGYCPKLPVKGKHKVKYMVTGKTPQDAYFAAVTKGLVSRLDHAAYLGKELQKAYIAMQLGLKYTQDDELITNIRKESRKRRLPGKNSAKGALKGKKG